jgi:hypothetical protein
MCWRRCVAPGRQKIIGVAMVYVTFERGWTGGAGKRRDEGIGAIGNMCSGAKELRMRYRVGSAAAPMN